MNDLTGEYRVRIDDKGRLKLPSALLSQIGEDPVFTINRGFEKHLMLYPREVWVKKTKEINKLNIYKTKERNMIRYFYRGASELRTDAADRVLIPKSLMEYAKIDKEVVLFAYNEQIEIWSDKLYEEFLGSEPEEFAEYADEIFGGKDAD